jgi:exo-beta-1,3-glucanase (GH17 family)
VVRKPGKTSVTIATAGVLALILLACVAGCGDGRLADSTITSPSDSGAAEVIPGPVDKLSGLCFSPFLEKGPSESDAVSPERVAELMDAVLPYVKGIRTFSSTGIGSVIPGLADERGLYVAAGCDLSDDPAYNEQEVGGLVELCRSGAVDLAVVGEEALFYSVISEADLIGYIRRVKETGVPVTTSETWGQVIAHPNVAAECDVVTANMFPYWEDVDVRDSRDYLGSSYGLVKEAVGDKEVVITTGWPSAGEPKGAAVPSAENARYYLSNFMSWAAARGVDYFYFEAFDEPWKAGREGEVGRHWGLWDSSAVMKPYALSVLGE